MVTEYSETEIPAGDARNEMLEHLAEGKPWVFLIASSAPGDGLAMSAETGGGIRDVEMVRKMLTLTLDALP